MFTHLDENQQPRMVDISQKVAGDRRAVAQCKIQLPREIKDYLTGQDIVLKKGPVIQTAIIAGTMAVKKTADLIPFCHTLPIHGCKFDVNIVNQDKNSLEIILQCAVNTNYKTGVEMEALCGASVAALTIYDMCKSISSEIVIKDTQLIEKTGGKADVKKIPLYGLVLTGGKSKRMGKDKALIKYQGQCHGQYIYDLLSKYCEQVFLSARPGQWQGTPLENLPTLVDVGESVGPISGILTALRSHPKVNWLIIACDLAYINHGMIEKLIIHARQDVVATCYANGDQGFPEALCGFYTPSALKLFTKAKNIGLHCPVKILQMADCQLIKPDNLLDITNVNTPEEYGQVN
ncbi:MULTISPECIES: cyclic pyranopterin monophosphate synthase MoaC [unclassified Synechocystis]|uniref:cyclic pyranopterin monophosphate synthase MoaC n=1 Tax=unclassified Synechocystis TaxID=2640012 RepID=UPI0004143E09|nr:MULTISPECIES: cyclic pyranopterin monophosphate synthase MoaC [unclassified Synechocystis]AIE74572.1 Molybdenum cofactor biosynthesis protein MoaC / Molybdopterin-guanine dinucleotide biosynthesis protein MobA [Synechocystis sp. PCC 6714]MCT0254064.1 cyclic pyranopterin monophosphate synthase MoaC [Synechocystis sp. CS-94]